ncbi:hypothetical protein ARMSODRAFT_1027882 [Armillaria solidipes]|uniref:Uncharacterized protein n=1 Tax=Armillaria solidipes TaxID=1076256 RepID=A0A2H3AIY9_9AGAR|nr:hypothetical protein ARMSODRAFT_1027882 [Armillaria solidipes]
MISPPWASNLDELAVHHHLELSLLKELTRRNVEDARTWDFENRPLHGAHFHLPPFAAKRSKRVSLPASPSSFIFPVDVYTEIQSGTNYSASTGARHLFAIPVRPPFLQDQPLRSHVFWADIVIRPRHSRLAGKRDIPNWRQSTNRGSFGPSTPLRMV